MINRYGHRDARLLDLAGTELKHTMINVVKDQVEKVGNTHEQMGIFKQEIETKKDQMEMLKIIFKSTPEIKIQWP